MEQSAVIMLVGSIFCHGFVAIQTCLKNKQKHRKQQSIKSIWSAKKHLRMEWIVQTAISHTHLSCACKIAIDKSNPIMPKDYAKFERYIWCCGTGSSILEKLHNQLELLIILIINKKKYICVFFSPLFEWPDALFRGRFILRTVY